MAGGIIAYPHDGMLLIGKDEFTVHIYKLFTGSRSAADTASLQRVNESKAPGGRWGDGLRLWWDASWFANPDMLTNKNQVQGRWCSRMRSLSSLGSRARVDWLRSSSQRV